VVCTMGSGQQDVRVSINTDDEFYVTASGQRIRLQRRNIGNRVPLILINGIGAAIEMWQPLVDELDERELISLDLPGCGLSPTPLIPARLQRIAALVTEVMDALDLERADILGYSFGGVVAMELAHRFPDRVHRLILASTVPGAPAAVPHPAVFALMLSPLRYYHRRAAELIIPLIAGGRTAYDRRQMRAGLHDRLKRPPPVRGYAYQLLAMSAFTSWPWLHRIPHRTLIVHGRDDPVSPALNGRLLTATMPNARLLMVAGGGHLLLLDEPGRVAPAIVEFLESARPPTVQDEVCGRRARSSMRRSTTQQRRKERDNCRD
jgi:pimeloyl-ACP methyl ester carboxylesterase